MNGKTLLIACLMASLGLSGCTLFRPAQDEVVLPDTQEAICSEPDCETDPFVNYTETRADFREQGELSPRDSLISQSGAGNNISAAVPPSIESEVISYEEQVENAPDVVEADADVAEAQDTSSNQEETENSANSQSSTADEQVASEQTDEQALQEEKTQEISQEQKQEQEEYADGEDPVRDWYAEEGQNLKTLLTEWSAESGWRLVWNTNRNYVLNAGAMFRGRFADVSSALIRAFARARPAPVATFYKGNRVLVVETMEDENAYD
ncbi:MAG: toxin co-regulated pilus biosynthesis Q family protein [Alphaproteobacteria bacterium]|nr:toxin co-regulated pilus biosynthesis Q family protein [Alphaproteobacteria bacterium]